MNNKNFLKGKKARYWMIGLVMVLVAALVFLRFNSAQASTSATVQTAPVTTLNIAQTVEASGSLAAQPSASLAWNTAGVVDQVNVKAGDMVKAGTVLMTLKTTSVSSSIISAQSDLVTAQQNLQNAQTTTNLAQAVINLKTAQDNYNKAVDYLNFLLYSQKVPQTQSRVFLESRRNSWMYVAKTKTFKGPAPQDWIVSAQNDLALKKGQLEDAQNAYDRLKAGQSSQAVAAAQAQVDAAQSTVDTMSVIAPFDGEVLYIESHPGDVVSTGTLAANIADLTHLYVEAQVDESDIANVKVGNPVTATLDAVPGLTLTGKIGALNPVGTVVSGLVKYTVRIDFDKTDTNLSLPLGATVNVTIQVKPASATLAVPVTAIQNDSQGEYVWVLRNGTPRRVNVVGGQIVGNLVAVTGNLKAGDVVELGQVNNSNFGGGFFRIFGGGRGTGSGRGAGSGQGTGRGG
jgi:HlyD family secretion protein